MAYLVLAGVVLAVVVICVYERLRRRNQMPDARTALERQPRWLRILAEYTIGGQPGQKKPTD